MVGMSSQYRYSWFDPHPNSPLVYTWPDYGANKAGVKVLVEKTGDASVIKS